VVVRGGVLCERVMGRRGWFFWLRIYFVDRMELRKGAASSSGRTENSRLRGGGTVTLYTRAFTPLDVQVPVLRFSFEE